LYGKVAENDQKEVRPIMLSIIDRDKGERIWFRKEAGLLREA